MNFGKKEGAIFFLAIFFVGYGLFFNSDTKTGEASRSKSFSFQDCGWKIEIVDTNASFPSLELDSHNRPHIAYQRGYPYYDLKYANKLNDISWDIEVVKSDGFTGYFPSIDVDFNGKPHIVYRDGETQTLDYTKKVNGSWKFYQIERIPWTTNSIVLDKFSNPHVVYVFYNIPKRKYELRYATLVGENWDIEVVDKAVWSDQAHPSLVLDSNNRPHISYLELAREELPHVYPAVDLVYATLNESGSWHSQIVEDQIMDTYGSLQDRSSIDIDSNDKPHISYYDEFESALKYATSDGINWDIQIVDNDGNVGQYPSIAIDSRNRPHISYYDVDKTDLKYAKLIGGRWSIERIDTGRSAGQFTSIDIDSNDNPHISYYQINWGENFLKYAFFVSCKR